MQFFRVSWDVVGEDARVFPTLDRFEPKNAAEMLATNKQGSSYSSVMITVAREQLHQAEINFNSEV